ncbi:MarR family transcriptional regulator [Dethiothermospora halolimnae]|uniref:MarR family transcriptional regulator n=1 Tax=Dethiothermospora halolimnae TaxID=3114390 RepID=UPI003CCC32B5
MENKDFESVVDSLFSILPVFSKKLIRPDKYNENIGLSQSHFQVLFLIEDSEQLSISEIGKQLCISKPNMTPIVRKLINKKLIKKIRNEEDKRYINIKLTKKGKELIEKHKESVTNNLKSKLLDLEDNDITDLSISLKTVKEILLKIE